MADIPIKDFEKVLPGAKSWMESFAKWTEKSLKSKGNVALTIGTMAAIVIAEELIKQNPQKPSYAYLDTMDEISDAVADGNMLKLVYNNIYDDDFNTQFDNYLEENGFDTKQENEYIKTQLLFEKTLYANFIDASDEINREEIWQCFALNENCEA